MRSGKLRLILFAVVFSSLPYASAQVDSAALSSTDWHTRAAAVRKLLGTPAMLDKPEIQTALIACLEYEDQILNGKLIVQPSPLDDETYGDNYLTLLEDSVFKIAQKTGNQAAFDALIRSAYNADSVVGHSIASRPSNLSTLLEVANDGGIGQRSGAASLIGEILSKSKSDHKASVPAGEYARAKNVLRRIVEQEQEVFVRQAATEAVGNIADQEDTALLQQVMNADSASYRGSDGLFHYPIREVAAQGLRNISNRSAEAPK